ncbi:MAG: AMP-dependent synthetase/ligase, partial [Planctomycetota bacterium]
MRGSVRQEGQELLSDLLLGAASRWPERVLLTRDQPDRPLEWTYRTFRERVEAIAVGLLDAGLRPGERVALFADNGRRWLETDQALALAGLVSVARGTDTAPAELALILEHSGARGVVLPSAERLDLVPESRRRARLSIFTLESGGPLRSNDELAERGKALLSAGRGRAMLEAARVDPGSTATIVYTSGTTGKPKGVMLSHANIRSNVAASNAVLSFTSGELCLSILPAWHMFERILEYVAIHSGCRLVYSDQRRLKDDMRTERPHAVAFVPRIWESIAAGIQDRLESLPPWRRRLVQPVLAWGRRLAREPGNPLFDGVHRGLSKILLRRLWRALGGRLRLGVSGGGSLPEDVDLLLLSLGMPLLNGYGLTETSPVVCVRRASANRAGSVGRPLPGTELRIVREDGSEADQGVLGEVWIRGPQVMQGYYRDEELTRE